jgi:hypothetical protein
MDAKPRFLFVSSCLFCLAAWPIRHAHADMSFRTEPTAAPEPTEPWTGIAASRGSSVVAVWSRKRVLVSEDGGRHFRERLEGAHEIDDVTVQSDGTVYVLRNRMLGIRRGGTDRWKRIPFAGFPSLIAAGAGRVVWLGHQNARPIDSANTSRPYVAVSADDGETWLFQRPSDYQELYLRRASVSDDGRITVDATFGDCRSWDAIMRGHVDGRRWRETDHDSKPGIPPIIDGKGHQWRFSDDGALERRSRESPWVTVQLPGGTNG